MHKYYLKKLNLLLFLLAGLPLLAMGKAKPEIYGEWKLVPESSSQVMLYNTVSLRIQSEGSHVKIIRTWGTRFAKVDSLYLSTDGKVNLVPIDNRVWPTQVFMGVSMIPGSNDRVTARWTKEGRTLDVDETYPVLVSQGRTEVHNHTTFQLSDDGQTLTMTIVRDTRPNEPLTYVFNRAGAHHAYYMRLPDNWEINGLLPENAFLISLQGVANTNHANLYFIYPDDWDFRFTPGVFDFYKNKLGYNFTELNSMESALKTFRKYVKGYVVWDKNKRTSLDVAFTVAGLKKAVVVSPELIPLMKEFGIPEVADFRGKFEGMDDAQIFSWAFNKYWDQCNHHYVVWMGGVAGNKMQPGIADFGIAKGAFFADLSTLPKDTAEYAMANKIFSHMKPLSMVMGWHSYAKDLERTFTHLTSHYALRVEGLNTFPNLSFTSNTPPSPGFKFKNHHNLVPGKKYIPKKKVYIALLQTDELGLGAWNKPGRGDIPYAWEVDLNWQWMAPTMLEYYYSTATKNDYFIGALSGPGYMYPKAIPPKYLPAVINKAYELMGKLDLNAFETMDYSQGSTVTGNTDLPKYIVDSYFKNMPGAIGFVNGYAPSYTFYHKDGRAFISFDYYLSQDRSVDNAAKDLEELARLNKNRPYFLLVHVREWNTIQHVEKIINKLGPDFKLVPLDVFLKLAGNDPTFKTRFMGQE